MVLGISVCRAWYVLVEKTEASCGTGVSHVVSCKDSLAWGLSLVRGFVSCKIDGGALANEWLR